MAKKYFLRLLTSDKFSSTSYVRQFDSISNLITYLIREYSLDAIDSVGFDDFDVTTLCVNDDDNTDGYLPFPIKLPFFKNGD